MRFYITREGLLSCVLTEFYNERKRVASDKFSDGSFNDFTFQVSPAVVKLFKETSAIRICNLSSVETRVDKDDWVCAGNDGIVVNRNVPLQVL